MKVLLIILLSLTAAFALEITVKPHKNPVVSQAEAEFFRYELLKQHIHIDEKEAQRVLMERRLLADAMVKENGMSEDDRWRIVHYAEQLLANRYIEMAQKKTPLSDNILYSYYKDHSKEFIAGDKIFFKAYIFNNFEDAYGFYKQMADSPKAAEAFASSNNIKVKTAKEFRHKMFPAVRSQLPRKLNKPTLLYPIVFGKNIYVFYITKIKNGELVPFDESVKKSITQTLYAKTWKRAHEQLLNKLKEKAN